MGVSVFCNDEAAFKIEPRDGLDKVEDGVAIGFLTIFRMVRKPQQFICLPTLLTSVE
jgi:hypothetical protein